LLSVFITSYERGRGEGKDYSKIEIFENYKDALKFMDDKKDE
jgi:hypothetical protein